MTTQDLLQEEGKPEEMPEPMVNPEWERQLQEQERIQKENVKMQEQLAIKQFKQQARYHAIAVVSEGFRKDGYPMDAYKKMGDYITTQAEQVYQWLVKDL